MQRSWTSGIPDLILPMWSKEEGIHTFREPPAMYDEALLRNVRLDYTAEEYHRGIAAVCSVVEKEDRKEYYCEVCACELDAPCEWH